MTSIKRSFLAVANLFTLTAALVACGGGGSDGTTGVVGLQSHEAFSEAYAAAPGYRLAVTAEATTLGPSIESIAWSADPLRDANGAVGFGDADCEKGTRSTRSVPGDTTKVVDTLTCKTYMVASEGSSGQFEVTSFVTLSDGSTHKIGFTVSIN